MRMVGLLAATAAGLMLLSGCVVEASTGAATPSTPTVTRPRSPGASPNFVTPSGFGAFQIGTTLADLRAQGLTKNVRAHDDCPGDQLANTTGAHPALLYFRNGALLALASESDLHRSAYGVSLGAVWDNVLAAAGDKATILERDADGAKSISLREQGTDRTVLVEFAYTSVLPVVVRIHAGNAAFLEGTFRGQGSQC